MSRTNFDMLLQAGCHFGHLRRKWNPAMAPYIYTERNGIHIIDLHKTVAKIDEAAEALKQIAKSGKKVLFVATKKQTKDVIAEKATSVNMPYVYACCLFSNNVLSLFFSKIGRASCRERV